MCFAIPNGGARDAVTAGRLKAEGVKAGVPDVCCPVARYGYHGLFLEFKKPERQASSGGGLSAAQLEWKEALARQGYLVVPTYGWQHGLAVLEWYLASV